MSRGRGKNKNRGLRRGQQRFKRGSGRGSNRSRGSGSSRFNTAAEKRSNDNLENSNLKNSVAKKRKAEHSPPVEEHESSSSSEEETENPMMKLLNSFGSKNKKSLAIESDETESSEDEEQEHAEEVKQNELQNDEHESEDEVEDNTDAGDATEEIDNAQDTFVKHLSYDLNESLLTSVQSTPMQVNTHTESWPVLGNLQIQIPKAEDVQNISFVLSEQKTYAASGSVPSIIDTKRTLQSSFIKTQICGNVVSANKSLKDGETDPFTPLQKELFSILNNYQDIYFPERTFANGEEVRFTYCLHAVNHVLKTRSKIVHHNAKLTKKNDVPEEFRDQGLVRPKVLIVVPFKESARRIVQMLIDILAAGDKGQVINKSRFIDDFSGGEISMPKRNPKPEDYEMTFSGNCDDTFRIGISVTKKSLKLYADFYSSDIIIASPLGLRMIIGAEGEAERDYDFLASIELLIMDQTEIFFMQNWDHLLHVLNHLHMQPKDSHGTDFSRVRTWTLNGWSKYYRQTLIFSSVVLPEINSIFNKKCSNFAGRIKVLNPVQTGTICQVVVQLPQVCHRFSADSITQSIDGRFNFFINKTLAQYRDPIMKQCLIYVPVYFDYVRIRNYFKKEDISFVQICEYSKDAKVARARDMFFHGDAHFLLYTERFHFFRRVRIKGIRHIIFYQPPNFPHFYSEMCNLMQEGNQNKKCGSTTNMTVTVLYSKYDIQQLTAIVGSERAARMAQSDRDVHMFVAGE